MEVDIVCENGSYCAIRKHMQAGLIKIIFCLYTIKLPIFSLEQLYDHINKNGISIAGYNGIKIERSLTEATNLFRVLANKLYDNKIEQEHVYEFHKFSLQDFTEKHICDKINLLVWRNKMDKYAKLVEAIGEKTSLKELRKFTVNIPIDERAVSKLRESL